MAFSPLKFNAYNPRDVPSAWMLAPPNVDRTVLAQQFAYEWLDSSSPLMGSSNPPFVGGAAGRLIPTLQAETGGAPRVLRGFIRRAEYDRSDRMSMARLHFFYNPEMITRDYVSYLDQGALDPFNTVFQSGNLVAPPSFMDFGFELFFDRQTEATDPEHPGVFVDYRFFDMVVRNVAPSDSPSVDDTLPDNGVMMVNPRDIVVVFSPQITVQGRPLNARVTFEKFTHRMTPTRMRIALTMRVVYFGPMRDMVEYKAEEIRVAETIPIDEIQPARYAITYASLADLLEGGEFDETTEDIERQIQQADENSARRSQEAMEYAITRVGQVSTEYNAARRTEIWQYADAASLVWGGWDGIGAAKDIGLNDDKPPDVREMMDSWQFFARNMVKFLWSGKGSNEATTTITEGKLRSGDLLVRRGHPTMADHIAFFINYPGGDTQKLALFQASSTHGVGVVTLNASYVLENYTHGVRPMPFGADNVANVGGRPSTGTAPTGPVARSQTVDVVTGATAYNGANTIRLVPDAAAAFQAWRQEFGAGIPCGDGWRDYDRQYANWKSDPKRFGNPDTSYHCKGAAVDVDNNWLNRLSAADQSRLRTAAKNNGWGQARYRSSAPGHEAGCNLQRGVKTDEPWHFSWGGCG